MLFFFLILLPGPSFFSLHIYTYIYVYIYIRICMYISRYNSVQARTERLDETRERLHFDLVRSFP